MLEEIEGDLLQQFQRDVKEHGNGVAKRKLLWNTLRFFRPGIILRNKFHLSFMNTNLFSNYVKVALRNLWRSKSYSAITIGGLAIGIACSLVIYLFVYGEWSYDKGFAHAQRTYRIGISFFNIGNFASSPEVLLNLLPKEFEGVEAATQVSSQNNEILTLNDQTFQEVVYYTDSSFFRVFDYKPISGNPANFLKEPKSVVLTDKMALKFFNSTDVLGKAVQLGKKKEEFKITGVVQELSFNSHLKASIWASNHEVLTKSPVWTSAAVHSYVMLKENVSEQNLMEALDAQFEHHVFPESGQPMGFKTLESYRSNDISVKFFVHRIANIHLKSKLNLELSTGGNESQVYVFGIVAMFIMALAAVNFINLTTARAARRAKEVGIRKTLGTARIKLVGQFLFEAIALSMVALCLAFLLAEVFLLGFHFITGIVLLDTIWQQPMAVGLFSVFALVVGILSGIYPAFYLSQFKPIQVLKGNIAAGGVMFRHSLVVFQFMVAMLLLVGAFVVHSQLNFMATKDLGFNQENVVTIDGVNLLKEKAQSFKEELAALVGVKASSLHIGQPGSKRTMTMGTFSVPGMEHPASFTIYFCDENYLDVHGIRLVAGRNFNKALASDSSAVILNQAAIKVLGIKGDPIGQPINENQKIIGVVHDFHWESLRSDIGPVALVRGNEWFEAGFKIDNQQMPVFLEQAETKWKQRMPDEPFRYHFLDENFGAMLKKESVMGKAIDFFTVLAVFISCLGLYGLSAYTTEQRTKEIGIRKVMGAASSDILLLLNRKFTMLVLLAIGLSLPLAYYATNQWLKEFAFKTGMSLWLYLGSALLVLLIAWLTVSSHSLRAAKVNPAEAIKHE